MESFTVTEVPTCYVKINGLVFLEKKGSETAVRYVIGYWKDLPGGPWGVKEACPFLGWGEAKPFPTKQAARNFVEKQMRS